MKKIICVLLAAVILASFVACDEREDSVTTSESTAVTDVTDEVSDTETQEMEESTEEETTESIEISFDPFDTEGYNDGFVSFQYPSGWTKALNASGGGTVSYGELVNIEVSVTVSTGIFDGLTKEFYESVFIPSYAEEGIAVSDVSISHKINRNDVAVTIINQTARTNDDGVEVVSEMDIFIVTLDECDITISVTGKVHVEMLDYLIWDSLDVVYDGRVEPPKVEDYDDYICVTEKLYLDSTVEDENGDVYTLDPIKLAPGESVATKFTVTEGVLSRVFLDCPSWGNCTGTLTIYVFEWVEGEGDTTKLALMDGYEKTIIRRPVASQTFVNFRDNSVLEVHIDDAHLKNGGTYLMVLKNPSSKDLDVGYQKSSYDARAYYGEVVYKLPDDIMGYYPICTTDVVAFNMHGVPATGNYMNLSVEVLVPLYYG